MNRARRFVAAAAAGFPSTRFAAVVRDFRLSVFVVSYTNARTRGERAIHGPCDCCSLCERTVRANERACGIGDVDAGAGGGGDAV